MEIHILIGKYEIHIHKSKPVIPPWDDSPYILSDDEINEMKKYLAKR